MQGFDKKSSINQIVSDYRLVDNDTPMLELISGVWDSYADKASVYPRLQDLYTRRHVADRILAGDSAYAVDWEQAGVSEKSGGAFDHLTTLRGNAHSEILRLEGIARANRPGAVGTITATAPVMAGANCLDPNARAYGGDVLTRTRNGRAF